VLITDDPRHWAGVNGDNLLSDNGEVYLTAGQTKRIQFGMYVPGAPDDVNFVEVPVGVWCDFLIIEKTLREFLGTAIREKRDTQTGTASSDDEQTAVATTPACLPSPAENQMKSQRRLAAVKIEPEFRRWREQQSGGYIPTEAEDIAHMKQLGVGRDAVRELRKKFPTRERGQKRAG
jgi:hypothetical protein